MNIIKCYILVITSLHLNDTCFHYGCFCGWKNVYNCEEIYTEFWEQVDNGPQW